MNTIVASARRGGATRATRGACIAFAAMCSLIAGTAHGLTADEIIANHVAARGGAQKLKTLKRTGRLIVPGFNAEISLVDYEARPNNYRVEFTLQGLTGVQAWDGHEGWQIMPFQGRKDPERLPADQSKQLELSADIDYPFVDYQSKAGKVEFLGSEDVDGTPAYKLRLTRASGDEIYYYIDPDSWMLIRDVQKTVVRGAEQITENDYGEYERVEGVWVPMVQASGPKGSDSSQKQQAVFEKAEANVDLPPSLFSFPASK
jgi:hypothetical protein